MPSKLISLVNINYININNYEHLKLASSTNDIDIRYIKPLSMYNKIS